MDPNAQLTQRLSACYTGAVFDVLRGCVTDGASRDCGLIQRLGFPVFCRGRTPRDVVGTWTPDTYDEPIVIGGCRIAPGDWLLGDIDGVDPQQAYLRHRKF